VRSRKCLPKLRRAGSCALGFGDLAVADSAACTVMPLAGKNEPTCSHEKTCVTGDFLAPDHAISIRENAGPPFVEAAGTRSRIGVRRSDKIAETTGTKIRTARARSANLRGGGVGMVFQTVNVRRRLDSLNRPRQNRQTGTTIVAQERPFHPARVELPRAAIDPLTLHMLSYETSRRPANVIPTTQK